MAERILVRAPNWIGDAVMSLGFLAALRKASPEAGISVLANEAVTDIFRWHPAVGGLMEFRRGESLFSIALRSKSYRFDSCYILPLSFSSAAIAFLSGIPEKIGFDSECRGWLLTKRYPYRKNDFRSRHLLLDYCRLLGGDSPPEDPVVKLLEEELVSADKWLAKKDIRVMPIGLGPGATYGPAKRWPEDRWIELGRALIKNGRRLIIFGSAAEADLCRRIAAAIGSGASSCAGETDLRQSAALLSKCRLFVSNDTGVMHLAAAAGTKVVALFGSTNTGWTRPWGSGHLVIYEKEPCSPCYGRTCRYGHYRCLTKISAASVIEAIDKEAQIR
jgi:heptosyltransferase-2